MDPKELVEEALRVKAGEFISLAEEAASELARSVRIGEVEIIGRLVKLPREGKAIIVGDVHGDLESLYYILRDSDFMARAEEELVYLVFLGDYGDRGIRSPEVYYVVLKLKELFPENVFLLRGNHEGPSDIMAVPHDLPHHMVGRFGDEGYRAYYAVRELWAHLYTAALVEGAMVMLHGGAPSRARGLEDVAFAHEKHPEEPHLEEILWSDPEDGIRGTYRSWRGAGRVFGPDVSKRFLDMMGARVLVRGHEPCVRGYKLNHGGLVLTLFSRKGPPYYNEEAAYLEVDLSKDVADARELEPHIRIF